jgi:hypothetical protein
MCFEDLVTKPRAVLAGICRFFEIDAGSEWTERAVQLVRGAPASRFPMLSDDDKVRLVDACRPGRALLGQ